MGEGKERWEDGWERDGRGGRGMGGVSTRSRNIFSK